MDPKNISILDFTYHLPEERIARYPLTGRDASRLLVYQRGSIVEDIYSNITQYLPKDSFLVFNDTKVIEARILFRKATGGVIEIFCLEPHEKYPDTTTAMLQKEKVLWKCLIGGASKWKKGQVLKKEIKYEGSMIFLQANYIKKKTLILLLNFHGIPGNYPSQNFCILPG